ncbi:MAG: UDP-N-acetylglucosamine 2-epimerase [Oscillospiraceae bacterium]|nr:UDP-N-acetylglucosamine 2-epimerase [Oscillospiraceae bacterium]
MNCGNKSEYMLAVVTGSRAEFGLLRGVIDEILCHSVGLQLLVTGAHLSADYGATISEITDGGYEISRCFDILGDNPSENIDTAFASAITQFGNYFAEVKPDMLILLGDRYEMLAVALAATFHAIPIAHISGGDVTEGALDDAYRHCITKLSLLHFPSTEVYANRVIQLGESPDRVFAVGALGVENILKLPRMSPELLGDTIGFDILNDYLLVTYHPETISNTDVDQALNALLTALETIALPVIFTKANADAGGSRINEILQDYCNRNKTCKLYDNLGSRNYLNAMRYAAVVVGNSSSTIVESPSLVCPAVNIGDRQKGRVMAKSIICCEDDSESILSAIKTALSDEFKQSIADVVNPYQGVDVAKSIVARILEYLDSPHQKIKSFYDL